jgi:hypothetical protein
MQKFVASYFRRGYTMSRRARMAHKNNEHPISYWAKEFALDNETIKKLLVYVGMHQTGLRAMRTRFYRMPDLRNETEYNRFFRVFHSIPVSRKKFINYMADELQEIIKHNDNKRDHPQRY